MDRKLSNLDVLLEEYADARAAGVFARTPQPSSIKELTTSTPAVRVFGLRPKWAAAATLMMALGVWTIMFKSNLSDLRTRVQQAELARANDLQLALTSCFGGPSSALNNACQRVDFDHDGDVDLGDFSTYQRGQLAVAQ